MIQKKNQKLTQPIHQPLNLNFMTKHNTEFLVIASLAVLLLTYLSPDLAFAGTGGEELQEVYEATESMVSGYFAKTVMVVAFASALIAGFKGNLGVGLSGLGVAVAAGIGPSIFTSGISALI